MNRRLTVSVLFLSILFLAGCASKPKYVRPHSEPTLKWKTDGKYTLDTQVGEASFYGNEFAGRKTASGAVYYPRALTAAHRTYPFGTVVRVTNMNNGKFALVRINDRGPFVKGRIIDLSEAAAEKIDMVKDGVVRVKLEVVEWGKK